jgi:cysteinyl-tRNA synthetase
MLKQLGYLLGLLQDDPERVLKGHGTTIAGLSDERIDQLIQERLDARKSKNWKRADEIRDELKANNIILEDGAQGTIWRRG